MNPIHIGPMIKFHRKKSGLTQEQLGHLAQLGKTVVFDIEHGKQSVKLSSLFKILKVLNIRLDFQSPLMPSFREKLDEKG